MHTGWQDSKCARRRVAGSYTADNCFRRCLRRSKRSIIILQACHRRKSGRQWDRIVSEDSCNPDDPVGKISLPSTTLHFFDLGGQRDIRSIWPKYYDECHAVVFVIDASDQGRLSEGWEVFGTSDGRNGDSLSPKMRFSLLLVC
jgi:hypothetical protein